MKIVIPGTPIPKARNRRRRLADGRVMDYDPQHAEKNNVAKQLQKCIKASLNSENSEIVMKASELNSKKSFSLDVVLYIPIPKSDSMAHRNAKLWGLIPHNQKPDSSNYLKFYEDAANSVLYDDDSMLCHVSAKKKWSDNPRTEINIIPMKNPIPDEVEILSHLSPNDLYQLAHLFLRLPRINQLAIWEDLIVEEKNRKEAAQILSEIADKFSDKLKKINKKCPGYWKKGNSQNDLSST